MFINFIVHRTDANAENKVNITHIFSLCTQKANNTSAMFKTLVKNYLLVSSLIEILKRKLKNICEYLTYFSNLT